MDRDRLQTFVMAAEDDLASVRSSLLIVAQTGDPVDLAIPRAALARLRASAKENELTIVIALCGECDEAIAQFAATDKVSPGAVYAVLDIVARIEAAVWDVPIKAEDFLGDISGFIDRSFEDLIVEKAPAAEPEAEDFEIDEETFDIFRSEAEELLSNIAENLGVLSESADDQGALWEVRRNAHTLKGAAGIVGLKDASEVAHRMEDLLDKLVETRSPAGPEVLTFLVASSKKLNAITAARDHDDGTALETLYLSAISALSRTSPTKEIAQNRQPSAAPDHRVETARTTTTPIVRVSLERLDELIKLANSLIVNRSAIEESLSSAAIPIDNAEASRKLEFLFDAQRALTDEIQTKLLKIRMVKFGTLETRLSRNVHVTCVDEAKKAILEIENGEVEVDTQVIDALIEPLLHLLKNAVVHGIEDPETRRLLGKPERGRIGVNVNSTEGFVILKVSDDGGGISTAKLREKAVKCGIITHHQADSMNDIEAIQLMFDRGLTTADKIDLNAGRGVGMSIVKEAIEGRGGSIFVSTEPQRGTTFTLSIPIAAPRSSAARDDEPQFPIEKKTPLVLIVDDSPSVRRQSTKLVEQAGLRVITANNGAEALELLLNGDWEPDLILSDVEMPQIDGWGLLEYVKTDENFGHIPVVMVTSLDAEEHRTRAADLGANDYLLKPLRSDDLDRVIQGFAITPA